jgi:antitoxin (DNA-binding transcriptional repressor) of toxin-antitoxin stability system
MDDNKEEKELSDYIEIVDTYNKEGYLIKRMANGVPVFIPKQDTPMVQIINQDTEWVSQTKYLTKEEWKKVGKNNKLNK